MNYRDKKDNYLKDIPRTYAYVDKVLNKYKDLSNLNEIFKDLDLLINYKMKVIILSSGKGTRMMPLTKNTPKPMLKSMANIYLRIKLIFIKMRDLHEININVAYKKNVIIDYIKASQDNINIIDEGDEPLGTAKA